MRTIVIYHSADFDGIFCREIARKFLPEADFIAWDFGDDPVRLSTKETFKLYILDLPVDRVLGLEKASSQGVFAVAPNIVWIDHHKSSIETHATDIPGYRIDGVAACRLAWQWFQPRFGNNDDLPVKQDFIDRMVHEPLSVRLAGEYDIWDKRDERAEVFQFGLRSRELTASDWSDLLSTRKATIEEIEALAMVGHQNLLQPDGTFIPSVVHQLLNDGRTLQRYQQSNDKGMMHKSFLVDFQGLKFLTLNTARFNSLTFASKDVPETGHDALMGFVFTGEKWTVSLYHANHRKDIDLSEIAVKYGGGGHRGACGFQVLKLPFLPVQ